MELFDTMEESKQEIAVPADEQGTAIASEVDGTSERRSLRQSIPTDFYHNAAVANHVGDRMNVNQEGSTTITRKRVARKLPLHRSAGSVVDDGKDTVSSRQVTNDNPAVSVSDEDDAVVTVSGDNDVQEETAARRSSRRRSIPTDFFIVGLDDVIQESIKESKRKDKIPKRKAPGQVKRGRPRKTKPLEESTHLATPQSKRTLQLLDESPSVLWSVTTPSPRAMNSDTPFKRKNSRIRVLPLSLRKKRLSATSTLILGSELETASTHTRSVRVRKLSLKAKALGQENKVLSKRRVQHKLAMNLKDGKIESLLGADLTDVNRTATTVLEPVVPVPKRRGRPPKQSAQANNVVVEDINGAKPVKRKGRPPKRPAQNNESTVVAKDSKDAQPAKRRGRPPKTPTLNDTSTVVAEDSNDVKAVKRRGRPPKQPTLNDTSAVAAEDSNGAKPAKRRGRPPKYATLNGTSTVVIEESDGLKPAKRRGRPPKQATVDDTFTVGAKDSNGMKPAKRIGRPPKQSVLNDSSTVGTQDSNGPKLMKRRGRPPKQSITASSSNGAAGLCAGSVVPQPKGRGRPRKLPLRQDEAPVGEECETQPQQLASNEVVIDEQSEYLPKTKSRGRRPPKWWPIQPPVAVQLPNVEQIVLKTNDAKLLTVKRKRGRPRKHSLSTIAVKARNPGVYPPGAKRRGRPPKIWPQISSTKKGPGCPRKQPVRDSAAEKPVATATSIQPAKRGPGRPRKNTLPEPVSTQVSPLAASVELKKRGPGRPRKNLLPEPDAAQQSPPAVSAEPKKRDPGRPRKHPLPSPPVAASLEPKKRGPGRPRKHPLPEPGEETPAAKRRRKLSTRDSVSNEDAASELKQPPKCLGRLPKTSLQEISTTASGIHDAGQSFIQNAVATNGMKSVPKSRRRQIPPKLPLCRNRPVVPTDYGDAAQPLPLVTAPKKRGPGRPRKHPLPKTVSTNPATSQSLTVSGKPSKKGPGRPRKYPLPEAASTNPATLLPITAAVLKKRGPGRPRKHPLPETISTSPATSLPLTVTEPKKRGPGRPRKHALPEATSMNPAKSLPLTFTEPKKQRPGRPRKRPLPNQGVEKPKRQKMSAQDDTNVESTQEPIRLPTVLERRGRSTKTALIKRRRIPPKLPLCRNKPAAVGDDNKATTTPLSSAVLSPKKRGLGRPRKHPLPGADTIQAFAISSALKKRGPGRPRKHSLPVQIVAETSHVEKRGPGRPRKRPLPETEIATTAPTKCQKMSAENMPLDEGVDESKQPAKRRRIQPKSSLQKISTAKKVAFHDSVVAHAAVESSVFAIGTNGISKSRRRMPPKLPLCRNKPVVARGDADNTTPLPLAAVPKKRGPGRPRKRPLPETEIATTAPTKYQKMSTENAPLDGVNESKQPTKRRRRQPKSSLQKTFTAKEDAFQDSVAAHSAVEISVFEIGTNGISTSRRRRMPPKLPLCRNKPVVARGDADNTTPLPLATVPKKRGSGRPRKYPLPQATSESLTIPVEPKKRGPGRPRKHPIPESAGKPSDATPQSLSVAVKPKKRRLGRPRKHPLPPEQVVADTLSTVDSSEPNKEKRGCPRKNPVPEPVSETKVVEADSVEIAQGSAIGMKQQKKRATRRLPLCRDKTAVQDSDKATKRRARPPKSKAFEAASDNDGAKTVAAGRGKDATPKKKGRPPKQHSQNGNGDNDGIESANNTKSAVAEGSDAQRPKRKARQSKESSPMVSLVEDANVYDGDVEETNTAADTDGRDAKAKAKRNRRSPKQPSTKDSVADGVDEKKRQIRSSSMKSAAPTRRSRGSRRIRKDCGICLVCQKGVNCGRCEPCLNMVEFGGDGSLGAKCILRVCITPILISESSGISVSRSAMTGNAAVDSSVFMAGATLAEPTAGGVSQWYDSGVESLSDNASMAVDDMSDMEWEDGYERDPVIVMKRSSAVNQRSSSNMQNTSGVVDSSMATPPLQQKDAAELARDFIRHERMQYANDDDSYDSLEEDDLAPPPPPLDFDDY